MHAMHAGVDVCQLDLPGQRGGARRGAAWRDAGEPTFLLPRAARVPYRTPPANRTARETGTRETGNKGRAKPERRERRGGGAGRGGLSGSGSGVARHGRANSNAHQCSHNAARNVDWRCGREWCVWIVFICRPSSVLARRSSVAVVAAARSHRRSSSGSSAFATLIRRRWSVVFWLRSAKLPEASWCACPPKLFPRSPLARGGGGGGGGGVCSSPMCPFGQSAGWRKASARRRRRWWWRWWWQWLLTRVAILSRDPKSQPSSDSRAVRLCSIHRA